MRGGLRALRGRIGVLYPRGIDARVLAALAACALPPGPLEAGDWEFEPRVGGELSYTDNVTLAAEDEESEFVTVISPGIRVTGEGRRASLDLDYRAEALFHGGESDRNEVIHELGAEGTIELVREQLFLDADATRSEDLVSGEDTVPDSNIFSSGARDSVTTYGIGPRLQYDLGSVARLRARYRREVVDQDDSRLDTETDTARVALDSGPRFNTWGWSASYERTDEALARRGVGDEDRRFERARGELNVRAGARTELFVAGGTEDNDFDSARFDEIDGDFWEAGFRWSPRRRVTLEAAVGERFFGDTARVSISAQGSALSASFGYREELVTESSLQFERSSQLVRDADGNIVLGPGGRPLTVVIPVPTLRDEVILERRATGRVAWERGHSRLAFSAVATEREFQASATREETRGVDLRYTWTRLVRTSVTASVGYTEQDFARRDRTDDSRFARLGANRDLGRGLSGSLELEANARDSTDDGADYDALRITAGVEKRF